MTASDYTCNPDLKRCNKCGQWKSPREFTKSKRGIFGVNATCNICRRSYDLEYRVNNARRIKESRANNYQKNHERDDARSALYRLNHLLEIAEYQSAYRHKHHRELSRAKLEYQRFHPEGHSKRNVKYNKLHPERSRAGKLRRRARLVNLPYNFTAGDWLCALEWWGSVCAYCGNPPSLFDLNWVLHADHFIPLSSPDCPGTTPGNIVPACQSCNLGKQNTMPHKWLALKFGKRQAKKIEKRTQEYFNSLKEIE